MVLIVPFGLTYFTFFAPNSSAGILFLKGFIPVTTASFFKFFLSDELSFQLGLWDAGNQTDLSLDNSIEEPLI